MAAAVAITSVLYSTQNEVAYLVTHSGGAGAASANLDGVGGATPDLVTDTPAGSRINALLAGDLSAGTTTYHDQAAARAALGLGTSTDAQLFGKVEIKGRGAGSAGCHWWVDANVTGVDGDLRLTVGAAADGTAVLTIKRRQSIGHQQ